MSDDLERNFIRVVRLAEAAGLPEVTIGTSYGTPALLVKDKSFVRMKDGETLVVMCALPGVWGCRLRGQDSMGKLPNLPTFRHSAT